MLQLCEHPANLTPTAEAVEQALVVAGLAVDATRSVLRDELATRTLALADACCRQRDEAHALLRAAQSGDPEPFYLAKLEECLRWAEIYEGWANGCAKQLAQVMRSSPRRRRSS